jgi:hypothetical protein
MEYGVLRRGRSLTRRENRPKAGRGASEFACKRDHPCVPAKKKVRNSKSPVAMSQGFRVPFVIEFGGMCQEKFFVRANAEKS